MDKETLARRIEEKLNSLEVEVSSLHTNIVYARTELLRTVDKVFEGSEKEPPKKRMTNLMFVEWLAKGNGQWRWKSSQQCSIKYECFTGIENDEVDKEMLIRPFGTSQWIEPAVDIYERDCKKE